MTLRDECRGTARILCAAALVLSAASAHAQSQQGNTAKEYNRVAIDAFKAGDYETALENFTHAFELNPDPKLRLNLAVTNENLNRLDEARDQYDAFLRENPRSDKAATVKDKLTAIEKKMHDWGKVLVSVEPNPDAIELGGRRYTTFPVRAWLAPGKHPMKVVKNGFDTHAQDVEVKPGVRFEVRVTLRPAGSTPPPVTTAAANPATNSAASSTANNTTSTTPGAQQPAGQAPATAKPAETTPETPATTTSTAAGAESGGGGGGNPVALALRGIGGAGLGLAVFSLLGGAMLAALSGGTLFYWAAPASVIPVAPVGGESARPLYAGIIYGAGGFAAVSLVLLPVLAVAGVGALAASFFL